MSIIRKIQSGIYLGQEMSLKALPVEPVTLSEHNRGFGHKSEGHLFCADNLEFMKSLKEAGYSGEIKTIYIDPPFFTRAKYDAVVTARCRDGGKKIHHLAYSDSSREDIESYVAFMTARLILMRDLLADNGLIWIHLDWHSSHYVRLILDEVFGEDNFVNEIIWKYKSGGSSKNHFSRKHDTILVYCKAPGYYINIPKEKSYNRDMKPYKFKGVKEYEDESGWYTLVNMKDVWQINMVGRTSAERNGYATQKPKELMKYIIEASSRKGDMCADFFCGSGSYLSAASELGRRWIGCDSGMLAISLARKRLGIEGAAFHCMDGRGGIFDQVETDGSVKVALNGRSVQEDIYGSGEGLGRYGISEFRPGIDYNKVAVKDRDKLKFIADSEPISLIDYVLVGEIDKGNFIVKKTFGGHFDDMKVEWSENMVFKVVDIFGKEYISKY